MKKILLLLLAGYAWQATAQDRKTDVQHYRFDLTLTDSSDHISGKALVTVKFLQPAQELALDLTNTDNAGKGMTVHRVSENGNTLSYTHNANKLVMQLPSAAAQNDVRTFEVTYGGVPKDGLIISKNKFKRRTFFGDNWPDRAKNWLPCVDDPADKASVEFVVTAPIQYKVVSNGVQVEETTLDKDRRLTHWKEDALLPTKIMVIGVAEFAVQYIGDTLNVPIYSWVYPQDKDKAFYDYSQAKEVLPFFINNIAPFPYRKLANVQSTTIFGGMENAGCIFYSEAVISGQRKAEDLLAHEIAHQWFGNMATEKSFAHLWLSEGFATYMTDLYMGARYGTDTMNKRLDDERRQVIAFNKRNARAVVDSATKNFMQLLNANSYQKGAWVLHMLREQMGADAFMQGVRAYYKQYGGGNASTDDLRRVMEKTAGKDLQAFFRQWLFTPGHPILDVQHAHDAKKNELTVTVTQKQDAAFTFPLEIALKGKNGTAVKKLQVTKPVQQFTFANTPAPESIVIDPGVKLLYEAAGR